MKSKKSANDLPNTEKKLIVMMLVYKIISNTLCYFFKAKSLGSLILFNLKY